MYKLTRQVNNIYLRSLYMQEDLQKPDIGKIDGRGPQYLVQKSKMIKRKCIKFPAVDIKVLT